MASPAASSCCIRKAAARWRCNRPIRPPHPLILQNFLSTDDDWQSLRAGVTHGARSRRAAGDAALHRRARSCPACKRQRDEEIDEHIRKTSITVHHPLGTCRMGPDSDALAVVDPQLRVRGVEGLRVVDASVMPDMLTGNINAAVIMIAEKAADLIKAA